VALPTRALCALTAATLIASAAPVLAADAPADPGVALSSKIDGAIASATSYRVLVAGPDGLTIEIRSFGPDRVHVASTIATVSSESIVIGSAMYYRASGSDWKTAAVPLIKHVRKNRLYMGAPDTVLSPLDDRTEDGVTVGAFRSPAAVNPSVTGTMDCSYDKTTFRPRTCTISVNGLSTPVRVSYDRWDDPTNAVEPPPGIPPPTPAPAPAPSRAPGSTVPGAPH
jgi:hypothetical protein